MANRARLRGWRLTPWQADRVKNYRI
jgi:hypothetical protein